MKEVNFVLCSVLLCIDLSSGHMRKPHVDLAPSGHMGDPQLFESLQVACASEHSDDLIVFCAHVCGPTDRRGF